MKKQKDQFNKTIIALSLILSLVSFSFPFNVVLAEGEEIPPAEETVVPLPETETPPEELDATIVTDDAAAVSETENIVNSNINENGEPTEQLEETAPEETAEGEESQEESGEPPENSCDCTECECATNVEVTIQNQADVENNVEAEASTGENEADAGLHGDATIVSGNANSFVDIFNLVNSNIVGSNFFRFLFNIFFSATGNIDLSDELGNSLNGVCEPDKQCFNFNVSASNEGSIENNVSVGATTGLNEASAGDGDARIFTGNANAVANVVNILNSNIIGSNWSQLIINIFGDWQGDLVLPDRAAMQELMEQGSGCQGDCGGLDVSLSNSAEVSNNVSVSASTGDNEASGGENTIVTGQAQAQADVYNLVNSNVVSGNWFFLKINNFGNWDGSIFGLPEGFLIDMDSGAIKIYNPSSGQSAGSGGGLNVSAENSGSIENNISVSASTGGNSAFSNGGETTIATGNANAIANLINVMNSNVVGNNWLFGMINVFGNWQGSLTFGQPDLWIGATAHTNPEPLMPGGTIGYTLTYFNRGTADAQDVSIRANYSQNHVLVISDGGGNDSEPGEITWHVGDLPVGGFGQVSFGVALVPDFPGNVDQIKTSATISGVPSDANPGDNTDNIAVSVLHVGSYFYPELSLADEGGSLAPPSLEISQSNDSGQYVYPNRYVNFKTVLYNNSDGPAYNVIVKDTLRPDGSGEVVNEGFWNLGKVLPHEEVEIEYTIKVNGHIEPGVYINTSEASGQDSLGNPLEPVKAYTIIKVRMPPEPIAEASILGAQNGHQKPLPPAEPKIVRRIDAAPAGSSIIPEASAQERPLMPKPVNQGSRLSQLFASIGPAILDNWLMLLAILLALSLILAAMKKREKKQQAK